LSENWTSSYIINLIYLKCNPFSASMNLYMHSASIWSYNLLFFPLTILIVNAALQIISHQTIKIYFAVLIATRWCFKQCCTDWYMLWIENDFSDFLFDLPQENIQCPKSPEKVNTAKIKKLRQGKMGFNIVRNSWPVKLDGFYIASLLWHPQFILSALHCRTSNKLWILGKITSIQRKWWLRKHQLLK